MAQSKTFKIGESCEGGIIEVVIKGKLIQICNRDWNTKKELKTATALTDEWGIESKIMNFLEDLTSYYYAEKVMTWIKSKVKLGI